MILVHLSDLDQLNTSDDIWIVFASAQLAHLNDLSMKTLNPTHYDCHILMNSLLYSNSKVCNILAAQGIWNICVFRRSWHNENSYLWGLFEKTYKETVESGASLRIGTVSILVGVLNRTFTIILVKLIAVTNTGKYLFKH